jgi:hypothetical protein
MAPVVYGRFFILVWQSGLSMVSVEWMARGDDVALMKDQVHIAAWQRVREACVLERGNADFIQPEKCGSFYPWERFPIVLVIHL